MKKVFLKLLFTIISALTMISCAGPSGAADGILIEAESMDSYGGWVLDQQSMASMGSPYLLAHGMGVPVEDVMLDDASM